jgi:hypothetical protein
MNDSERRMTHAGRPVLRVWAAEFEGSDEADAHHQAADWLEEIGGNSIVILCSGTRYCEDGMTVLTICYETTCAPRAERQSIHAVDNEAS